VDKRDEYKTHTLTLRTQILYERKREQVTLVLSGHKGFLFLALVSHKYNRDTLKLFL
jgi:hypothetical protein